MARMSREFQLVLLGAGILTAGSFLWPDPSIVDVAENQANDPDGGNHGSGRRSHMPYVMFFHSRSSPSRTMLTSASPSVTRGGFGSSGARFSGGG